MLLQRWTKAFALGAATAIAVVAAVGLHGNLSPAGGTLADGDMQLGYQPTVPCSASQPNCETNVTQIYNTNSGASDAFSAVADGGNGIWAASNSNNGVVGNAFGYGAGVHAYSLLGFGFWALGEHATGGHIQTNSQYGAGAEIAIDNKNNARGALEASTNGPGQGVLSNATTGAGVQGVSQSGSGVLGISTTGFAIKALGKASFNSTTNFARSGRVTIGTGQSQVTKTNIALSAASLVLATVQGNVAGVYVQGVTIVTGTSGSFTIHLNKSTPANLTVAWFVVN